jgi:hypothetical protein
LFNKDGGHRPGDKAARTGHRPSRWVNKMELKKMSIKFPKVRGERLIIIALAMILIAEVISTFWNLEKVGADGRFQFQIFLSNSLQMVGSLLLIVSLITTGIRKMRRTWPTFIGIAMLLIGLCLCAIPLLSVQMYKKIGRNLDEIQRPSFDKMEAMMKKSDLPANSRIKLSKMYAHEKYLYEGVIVSYVTETGEQTRYVPSKKDIEFRSLKSTTIKQWNDIGKGLPIVFWTWAGIAVISLSVGALSPIQKTTPNTRSDHDRA